MTYGTSSSSCTRFVLPQGLLRPLSPALGVDKASYLTSRCFFITIVTPLVLMLKRISPADSWVIYSTWYYC